MRTVHCGYAQPPDILKLQILTCNACQLLDEWGDLKKDVDDSRGCLAALSRLKKDQPHLKTLISVGGGSGSKEFPVLAASEETRRKFAEQIRDFCCMHQFDGVDGWLI